MPEAAHEPADGHLLIQQPVTAGATPAELLLLFHGVGASADDMLPLGRRLAALKPQAWVVSVQSPDRSDLGSGWQWFSVHGVTEQNRAGRVVATLPRFLQSIADWQRRSGVGPERTTVLGFSQGAIMALASTQHPTPMAARVIAVAGRFAPAPLQAPAGVAVHLLHGDSDPVVPAEASVTAAAQLRALGASVTLDLFPGLGHGIDGRVARRIDELVGG